MFLCELVYIAPACLQWFVIWHHCFQPTQWLTSALFIWHEPDESQLSNIFWYQPESNITVCSFAFDTLDESRQSRAVFWSDCCLCVFVSVWAFILMCLERRLLWKGDLSSCAGDCGWWGCGCWYALTQCCSLRWSNITGLWKWYELFKPLGTQGRNVWKILQGGAEPWRTSWKCVSRFPSASEVIKTPERSKEKS